MWGNRPGWIIAAILSVLILAPVVWVVRAGRMSAPNGIALDSENLKTIQLPVDAEETWPLATEGGDAGAIYRAAIDAWNDDAEAAAKSVMSSGAGELPDSIKLLVSARHLKTMTLFAVDLGDVVNYDNDRPRLEKLFAAGEWSYKIGLSLNVHGNTQDGTACLEAAFALGRQLFDERITFDECQKGMQLMADAATARRENVERLSVAWDRLEKFTRQMDEYQTQHLIPIWQTIGSVDQEVIDRSAGDVAMLAEQSRERMWRVESTLKLGRFRFNAGSGGDQAGATRLLRKLIDDPDPAVSRAAQMALKLDIETYRMIH
jgi:hypothetical protein